MYQNIHVALDGSECSKGAATLGLELAEGLGSRLTAVHVKEPSMVASRIDRLKAMLTDEVETGSAEIAGTNVKVRTGWLADDADDVGVSFGSERLEGSAHESLLSYMGDSEEDLMVFGAWGDGEGVAPLGSAVERFLRRSQTDTLVVKNPESLHVGEGQYLGEKGAILVCIDGSPRSYHGLRIAIQLAKKFQRRVEAVGVYDPYLHYTLFNGIVGVLSEKASKVFKFADQEKLHEEIIDTGLAKIYQAHLDVARKVAEEDGVQVRSVLLDGKAYEKILQYARKTEPALLVLGRIGVHSGEEMDIGATAENLLRSAPCNVLVTSQKYTPAVDLIAAESVDWTPAALTKMARVPGFVKGVATTAVIRWAVERGYSVITAAVINEAMGDLLPPGAAQSMGYVAEEVAKQHDDYTMGKTFICPECGYAAKDYQPKQCAVCSTSGDEFQMIDRDIVEKAGVLDSGELIVEDTFDGKKLTWTIEAKQTLARVPKGYDRRRCKARIEKTARVRGFVSISNEFALDMIQQDNAETSYLSDKGEVLRILIAKNERPDDEVAIERKGSDWKWTEAAWKRIGRVPSGFMRDMTRDRVEQFVQSSGEDFIALELCEAGIAAGRRMMAEMLGSYSSGESAAEQIKDKIGQLPGYQAAQNAAEVAAAEVEAEQVLSAAEDGADSAKACPASGMPSDGTHAKVNKGDAPPAECPASGMTGDSHATAPEAGAVAPAACPASGMMGDAHATAPKAGAVPPAECPASGMMGDAHATAPKAGAVPPAECPASGMTGDAHATAPKAGAVPPAECPAHGMFSEPVEATPEWTEGGQIKVDEATARMEEAGKFDGERAEELVRGVAEERAKEKSMTAISEAFMQRLGKQLGYGHPLAEETAKHQFEWTAEAEAELEDIPDFCREMTKWRVEWTAVKKDLGRVITPEIMKAKYDMWGEVSEAYMEREGKKMNWEPEAWARVANIPDFVRGQVLESIEGNAEKWGTEMVTNEVLDRVIQKWIETGDFHEAQFGYK
jgi:nucleotide-binding universal stress UspA family protein